MEQSYAEANAKENTTGSVIALKIILIILVVLVFLASILISISTKINLLVLIGVAAIFGLIWYWPRFRVEWEYVFCDGQLDFDMIQGGERRMNILRIDIEDAVAIGPIQSIKLHAYRHLEVRDYSSMNEKANVYGIATRLPEKEEKVMILFEPTSRMVELMQKKCPEIVSLS